MAAPGLSVEVIYGGPGRCRIVKVTVPVGAAVGDAIQAADPGAAEGGVVAWSGVAIHGRIVGHDCPLREGDRVELLRSLQADPKQARRARANRPARTD